MTRYLNFKSVYGTETVDELKESDFSSYKEFIKELRRLISEYKMSGTHVYSSQRCTKDWKSS